MGSHLAPGFRGCGHKTLNLKISISPFSDRGAKVTTGIDPCTPQQGSSVTEVNCSTTTLPWMVWGGTALALVVIVAVIVLIYVSRPRGWHLPDIEDPERLR